MIKIEEAEYREAYLLWKETNEEVKKVPFKLVVELPNGEKIPLGGRIHTMKQIYRAMQENKHFKAYRDLTEEQISWWMKQGVKFSPTPRKTTKYTEEEYR